MQTVVLSLAALACPLGMCGMMWLMSRGTRRRRHSSPSLDALRDEHRRLAEEIERRERDATAAGTRA